MSSHIDINSSNFQTEVLDAKGLVFVDIWATWCVPCQILGPIIEEIGEEYKEKVKVCKLEGDSNIQLVESLGIMGYPTILVYKDGQLLDSLSGARPKDTYVELIEKYSK